MSTFRTTRFLILAIICGIFFAACSEEATFFGLKSPLNIGDVYRTLDERGVIKVISTTELEIGKGSNIVLGTYSIEGNTVRSVFTVLGTKKVRYYEIVSDGLQEKSNGKMYYSSDTFPDPVRDQMKSIIKGAMQ